MLPFLRGHDFAVAKAWHESIGFICTGAHEEPGCGLDWALMAWDDAMIMLPPHLDNTVANANNCGLYFKFQMDTTDGVLEK